MGQPMTRIRQTVIGDSTTTHNWDVYNYGSLINQYVYHYNNHEEKVIEDVTTPDYVSRLKTGAFLPINPVKIRRIKKELISPFSGVADNGPLHIEGEFLTWSGAINGGGEFVPDQSDLDRVVIMALAKAKNPDWDALTFLGEFGQTVDLLKNALKRFDRIAKWIAKRARRREIRRSRRQGRKYSYRQALQDFSNLWLEGRYGWRPLVYDVQDILDLLTKASKVSTARRSAWFVNSLDSTSTHIYDAGTTRYTEVVERKGTVKYRAVVFHRSNMSRIGVNPIVTAWELTKYSFVIDWFVDIGQWLQAISPVVGYNQLGVSLSWTVQTTDHEKSTVVGQSGWTLDAGMMDRKITRHDYTRQNYTEIPLPSYLNKLDYLKDIDLATLALQSLAGVSSTLMYAR